jgi:carbon storage regulator
VWAILVLTRHREERIMIGDDIVITVVDIRGDKVRLGIDAPIDITVHREEVLRAIQRETENRNGACQCGNRLASLVERSKGVCRGCGTKLGGL